MDGRFGNQMFNSLDLSTHGCRDKDIENSTGCARSAKRRGWGAGGLGQYPWWVLIKPGRSMSQRNVIVQQVIADLQRRNSLCTDLNFTDCDPSQNATMHGDKHEFPVSHQHDLHQE